MGVHSSSSSSSSIVAVFLPASYRTAPLFLKEETDEIYENMKHDETRNKKQSATTTLSYHKNQCWREKNTVYIFFI
jgi:hypothetical protein